MKSLFLMVELNHLNFEIDFDSVGGKLPLKIYVTNVVIIIVFTIFELKLLTL